MGGGAWRPLNKIAEPPSCVLAGLLLLGGIGKWHYPEWLWHFSDERWASKRHDSMQPHGVEGAMLAPRRYLT